MSFELRLLAAKEGGDVRIRDDRFPEARMPRADAATEGLHGFVGRDRPYQTNGIWSPGYTDGAKNQVSIA